MGAISGEELVKWEKMQGQGATTEKILVLVRLRPLSEKEFASNEVSDWECINDTTILYRNTLREGSTFPSAYSFDKVFRGDCSTRQVYEEGAREIALSVVNGINSSIFAYGQTSSGKTYTMNGITEYTAAEIFDYVHKHEERAFVVKFSAIEIYNEVVRDLLGTDNTPLRLLDDPDRGTIVEKLTEETLRDWNHLAELLSICEAQRQIGETSLNEKSSRSHQIIRLSIESSAREFLGKDNSTTLAASVSFIDLAGSERASQALSAGTRLKEGCHINRSLLTLGTVIRKLSKGRHGHINYRDSKLTRILQPSLGGNARTAIVCTLSPARTHVEQTRNTLLFACCAKEVTTKAQVNVVMSDKALVKHLQKELARLESELRTPVPVSAAPDYAALLRKKDLQIEKMAKEIRELTKQRDLAQSRVQDLLQMVGSDQTSRKVWDKDQKKSHKGNAWEDDGSVLSESSGVVDPSSIGIRSYNNPHYGDRDNDEVSQVQENPNDDYLSDGTSSPRSTRKNFVESRSSRNRDNMVLDTDDDYCKEVQCIEMEESSRHDDSDNVVLSSVVSEGLALSQSTDITTGQANSTNRDRTGNETPNGFTYNVLAQRLDCLASPYPDGSKSSSLARSWSCRANLMSGLSSPDNRAEKTPSSGFEKGFPGRPEGFGRKFPPLNLDSTQLSRNDSESSFGSASKTGEEGVTSLHTFVAGLKEMAKVQEMGPNGEKYRKSVKEMGIDTILETPQDWPMEFERQQREILELWQTCHVSLVHRTYFFLLFKGDPSDSIYMEVELRRLFFLKETYTSGNEATGDSRIPTVAASMKALRREREVLGKLMQKRLSDEARKRLFQQWGVELGSKRRRLQLAKRLWSDSGDLRHARESAAIVAKLVRFSDQGRALREMFGLSFAPAPKRRSSFGWRTSKASSLLL